MKYVYSSFWLHSAKFRPSPPKSHLIYQIYKISQQQEEENQYACILQHFNPSQQVDVNKEIGVGALDNFDYPSYFGTNKHEQKIIQRDQQPKHGIKPTKTQFFVK